MTPGRPIELRRFHFDGGGVTAAVTTRHGGVSTGAYASLNLGDHVGDDHAAVLRNRDLVAAQLRVDRLTIADQQHRASVAVIDASLAGCGHAGDQEAKGALAGTDGMVTNVPGAAIGVMVADCAPVVLVDPARRAVGVAHCGRNGTVLGVLPHTIDVLVEQFGSDPADLLVGIGPCIAAESYEIGEREADQAAAALPASVLSSTRPGHFGFDLVGSLRWQLDGAGVDPERVFAMGIDTRTSTDIYFSDRAQRPCGRFMALVVLRG